MKLYKVDNGMWDRIATSVEDDLSFIVDDEDTSIQLDVYDNQIDEIIGYLGGVVGSRKFGDSLTLVGVRVKLLNIIKR